MKLTSITIRPNQTIREAMETINHRDGASCLVVDSEGRLKGTISDGDVRRGLLRGEALDSPVENILYTDPTVAQIDTSDDELLLMMQTKGIRDIPLIDEQGTLIVVRTLKELLSARPRDNWVVLMAGGTGRRLMPLTEKTPKPMLEIDGRPLLETIILKLVRQGFRKFYLSVNYLSHVVKQHFEYGERWGVDIRYLEEDEPLGTGGALGLISGSLENPVVVMNGDILTGLNIGRMIDFHERSKAIMTVGVRSHEIQLPYGVFTTDGERVSNFREKPVITYSINAGIYVVAPAAFKFIPRGEAFDMPDFAQDCMKRDKDVMAFQITESWLDIGEHSELERAKQSGNLLSL